MDFDEAINKIMEIQNDRPCTRSELVIILGRLISFELKEQLKRIEEGDEDEM